MAFLKNTIPYCFNTIHSGFFAGASIELAKQCCLANHIVLLLITYVRFCFQTFKNSKAKHLHLKLLKIQYVSSYVASAIDMHAGMCVRACMCTRKHVCTPSTPNEGIRK